MSPVCMIGMGCDGALGRKAMRDIGAFTIGQHEATSTIHGMPPAAVEVGAGCSAVTTRGDRIGAGPSLSGEALRRSA